MIILGLDPGSVRIGYGVIKKRNGDLEHVESGLLNLSTESKKNKLAVLEKKLLELIARTKPDLTGVEKLYFTKNRKTGIDVAQARGVIMTILSKLDLPFIEPSPSQVKLAATGNGRASKNEVAKMVSLILNLNAKKRIDDVTDALAIAITASVKPLGRFDI